MKDYFYTDEARDSKIYVSRNLSWTNQLMYIESENVYCWFSLDQCDTNLDVGALFDTLQEAIEYEMTNGNEVYQLDSIEELAQFILGEL